MFICQVCGKIAPPNTRCTMILAERRLHQHPFRSSAHVKKNAEGRLEHIADQGGKGFQIVKELKACVGCRTYSPLLSSASDRKVEEELQQYQTNKLLSAAAVND